MGFVPKNKRVVKIKHVKLSDATTDEQQHKKNTTSLSNITSEVIAITSKEDSSLFIYDLRNGNLIATFNNTNNDTNGFCTIGSEYFATSQANKAMINIYNWKKDQPIYKTPIQEKSGPICCSSDGNYLVMGSASGMVYLWEVSTGTLLRMWEAHYNKISCITFTKDDFYIITAGDDGIINCWSFEQCLDRDVSLLRARNSFSDHSLGITSIVCSFGGCNSRLFSVSLDRTCKIWDLVTGRCINSIIFPTYLTSVCLDSTETTCYVGGGDGIIYQTDLIQLNPQSIQLLNINNNNNNNNNQNKNNKNNSLAAQSFTNENEVGNKRKTFNGHTKAITSISLSMDGSLLISGSIDGNCNIWDTFSRQIVRSIANTIKGSISSLSVLMNPIDSLNFNVNGTAENNKKASDPIAPFEKYSSNNIERTSVPIKLKQIDDNGNIKITVSNLQSRIENTIVSNEQITNHTNLENNNKIIELNKTIQEYEKEILQFKKQIQNLQDNNNTLKLTNDQLSKQFVLYKQQQQQPQQSQQQKSKPAKKPAKEIEEKPVVATQETVSNKKQKTKK
ncbi:WD40 repeat-containing protein [Dictyostelium discoideum AX4]|uniref:WD40 repeat-containing protein n=1 Tax=Dictyostelium discoideum TaxID=44689 RepID=Q54IM3_DICDI|nr:WD40 repeat-containing protein [Dictyostelium discoideum AX4]EAL63106.1 WD40 repeat-containing protein [Dictyostelium discoideum AX4]|eukprot:XP_636608.1 WD40 repeat-containing protein [Dictyostelium discoideum AX4]